jgi:hypothetical protein
MKTRTSSRGGRSVGLKVARILAVGLGLFGTLWLGVDAGFAGSAPVRTGGAATAPAPVTFSDPAGDANGGPDITAVSITGDPATKMITFSATVSALQPASPDGLTRFVGVWLDSDKNASTGSTASGSEYALVAGSDSTGVSWDFWRWDGSTWQSVPQSSTMNWSRSGDVLTWTFSSADIGGATGFAFYIDARTVDASNNSTTQDFAPDAGKWTYDLPAAAATTTTTTTPPPTTTTTSEPKPTFVVKAMGVPHAGKRFVVRASLAGLTAAPTVACTAKVGTKAVRTTAQNGIEQAACVLTVPAGTTGKTLAVVLRIHFFSAATTRTLRFKIK